MSFECMDDVWKVVDLIVEEVVETNKETSQNFDLTSSLIAQLPFFVCPNQFYSRRISRDIERYSYCENTGVTPYKGTYGEQPADWVDRYFTIKAAYAKKESMMYKKMTRDAKMQAKKG